MMDDGKQRSFKVSFKRENLRTGLLGNSQRQMMPLHWHFIQRWAVSRACEVHHSGRGEQLRERAVGRCTSSEGAS